MYRPTLLLTSFTLLFALAVSAGAAQAAEPFDPSWESLEKYECPEWFRDAKLGIFVHWGLTSLQGVDDWYGFNMYRQGHRTYEHHVKTYGHPSKFGYKDFIPMWKAEHFDPDDLVRRFKEAGARYVVPNAVFHDNFDCWNSRHHRWNSVNMGPKKDIVGMWRAACRRHGLRFGVSTHLARSWAWFQNAHGADQSGPLKGVPYDGANPKYWDFYHPPGTPSRTYPVDAPQAWKDEWAARIMDLCEQHRPDLLYFDGGLPFPDDDGLTGRKVVAWYYNQSIKWHGGKNEAVLNLKKWPPQSNHGPFRAGMCVRDMERGLLEGIQPEPWQNDTTVSAWFYQPGRPVRPVGSVVDMLVDIVSKNGNLLLNVPPRPDGTLDEAHQRFLEELGRWMKVNGEAIYATRPWRQFGEGPSTVAGGAFGDHKIRLTSRDIRFTCSKDGRTVYAFVMDFPGPGAVVRIKALGKAGLGRAVRRVRLLGHQGAIPWTQQDEALVVTMPEQPPCDHAVALAVSLAE